MAITATTMVGVLLASLSLRAEPLPGFSLTAQTEHFSFYTRGGETVDVQKSERFLAQVEKLLGRQLSGRAEYYRYGNPEEIAAATGTYAAGVTYAQAEQIHSTQEFHAHEIVHLVAGQLGNPGSFFQEGLAVALGNGSKWNGKAVDRLARTQAKSSMVSALVAGFDRMNPQVAYPVAGSFVASLIKAHGIGKVADFFRACANRTTTREAAFARTFGQSLDEAGTAWAASL